MRTRPELIEWIAERIAWARHSAPHLVSLHGRAFMVHGTIGHVSYFTVDGEGLLEEVDAEGSVYFRSDPCAIRHVFFYGSKAYPELLQWLPERSPEAPSCHLCGGAGWQQVGPHSIGCTECGGFGWPVSVEIAAPAERV